MEKARIGEEDRIQKQVATVNNENKQMRSTVNSLRDKVEKIKFDSEERIQKTIAAANGECNQFKETISALRAQLDIQHAK